METIQFEMFRRLGANEAGFCDSGQLVAVQPGSPFSKNVAMLKWTADNATREAVG